MAPRLQSLDFTVSLYFSFGRINVPSLVLSLIEAKRMPPLLLSCKHMKIFTSADEAGILVLGIVRLLQSSADWETLEIEMLTHWEKDPVPDTVDYLDMNKESFWTSQRWISNCMFLHLRTVKIIHFHELIKDKRKERFWNHKVPTSNAKMLEQLVIEGKGLMKRGSQLGDDSEDFTLESKDTGKIGTADGWEMSPNFAEVAQNLTNFPRSNPNAVIIFHEEKEKEIDTD
ncbi:hypothetical protein ACH5RR_015018 [Cinchona calisaya]|uniref:F-box protein n=1 Tax=Cinchona calisaya TaxID=153742 RepID=A0ABD2ZSS1_9GENT